MVRVVETYALARAIAPEFYSRVLLATVSWDQPAADIVATWVAETRSLSWAMFTKRLETTFSPVTYLNDKMSAFIRATRKKGETIRQLAAKF